MIGGVLAELGTEGESLLRSWDGGRGEWGRGGFDRILKSLQSSQSSRKASLGTLFYLAKESGFRFPASYSSSVVVGPSGEPVAAPKAFDKAAWLAATKAEQAAYSRLDLAPTHEMTAEFIPQGWLTLPEQAGIIVLEAPMKSGKTATALLDLVKAHRAANPQAQRLQIVPRNNLGRQSGNKLGMPLHTDIPNFSIENCHDVTACAESGPAKLDPSKMPKLNAIQQQALEFGDISYKGNRPLFIFDEPSQTLGQLFAGGTTKGKYFQTLKRLIELLQYVSQNQGWVVLSEDGLTNLEVDFIKSASKLEVIDYYKFNKVSKDTEEREYTICTKSPSQVWDEMETWLADNPNSNFMLFGDSKRWVDDTVRKLEKLGLPASEILTATSDTSELPAVKTFAANPDEHLSRISHQRVLREVSSSDQS